MTFADKIKHVRMKLYLSQVALAKEMGISFATVNRWENGRRKPNLLMEAKFNDFCEKNNVIFEEQK